MHAALSLPVSAVHISQPPVAAPDWSELSRRYFLQDQIIKCQISHSPFKTGILAFQFLEAAGLIHSQPAIFLAPAIIRVRRHINLAQHLFYRASTPNHYLSLTQIPDNLLRRKSLPSHFYSSLNVSIIYPDSLSIPTHLYGV